MNGESLEKGIARSIIESYLQDYAQMMNENYTNFSFCGATVINEFIERFQGQSKLYIVLNKLYLSSVLMADMNHICTSSGCKSKILHKRVRRNCCNKKIFPKRFIRLFETYEMRGNSKIYYNPSVIVLEDMFGESEELDILKKYMLK